MTKILLVEDDKSLREIYGVRLLAEGYDIVSAGDGEEALAMAIKERPALIVSDVMMPKISGFDMLDILRSTTETRDIKVIMMTALSSEDQRLRGEKLGADRYLVKSQVGIEDVVRAVHEVLGDIPGMTPQPAAAPQPSAPTAIPTPQAPAIPQVPQPAAPSFASQTPTAAPSAPAPAIPQVPQPAATTLPQPTAPFSSAAPRPSNLGDRVIQPLQSADTPSVDVAAMMEQELTSALDQVNTAPTPQPVTAAPQPATPAPAPQPVVAPIPTAQPAQIVRPDVSDLSPQNPQIPQPPQPPIGSPTV